MKMSLLIVAVNPIVPFAIIAIIILLIFIVACIKIVPQATTFIIERFGAYKTTWALLYSRN